MIKTIDAWNEASEKVPALLVSCGLVDALTLSPAERGMETRVMFWELRVSDLESAKKKTYVTWVIDQALPYEYGDGESIARLTVGKVEVFSKDTRNSEAILTLISTLNTKSLADGWFFDLTGYTFDERLLLYHFTFSLTTLITEG